MMNVDEDDVQRFSNKSRQNVRQMKQRATQQIEDHCSSHQTIFVMLNRIHHQYTATEIDRQL